MTTRDEIIRRTIAREGGYVNDPLDRGGETNYGITVAAARANGYNGLMARMSLPDAIEIYRRAYWDAVRGDDLLVESAAVAEEVYALVLFKNVSMLHKITWPHRLQIPYNMPPIVCNKICGRMITMIIFRRKVYD